MPIFYPGLSKYGVDIKDMDINVIREDLVKYRREVQSINSSLIVVSSYMTESPELWGRLTFISNIIVVLEEELKTRK